MPYRFERIDVLDAEFRSLPRGAYAALGLSWDAAHPLRGAVAQRITADPGTGAANASASATLRNDALLCASAFLCASAVQRLQK